ncbi:Triosephosphate isomerase [Candidatus Bealeia paramacronuclearis]|uniref:Triosephosphate isomerase n=1 Tax=Candidatus Bealeia paramacronuclearis TaxID=1921001 RepID=A0ABZ2C5W2_9PROT|nr:Triosephosphate isomerase [Candidatus Bealeia paramacronuclearis]
MQQYIVGNWKMNGTRAEATGLAKGFTQKLLEADRPLPYIILCPSHPYLDLVHALIKNTPILLGAQDCHHKEHGAFTGDVCAQQLVDVGVHYVLLGHSERRHGHLESDTLVQNKVKTALTQKLHTIVCVGENKEERTSGKAIATVISQIENSLPSDAKAELLLIAYEPVWAIGTGLTPTLEDIERMHGAIRHTLSQRFSGGGVIPILYGGSVTASNAKNILSLPHVNGVLVGGASLKLDDFWSIIEASTE